MIKKLGLDFFNNTLQGAMLKRKWMSCNSTKQGRAHSMSDNSGGDEWAKYRFAGANS